MTASPDNGDRAASAILHDGEVVLAVEGPDINPATVSVPEFLELAAAFLKMVQASSGRHPVAFRGVEIRNKCAAVAAMCRDPKRTAVALNHTIKVIKDEAAPARGQRVLLDRFKRAANTFHNAEISILGATTKIVLNAPLHEPLPPLCELLTLRATPNRIGGAPTSVRFSSPLEAKDFTLVASAEQARDLGSHLYNPVEIDAEFSRDADGNIERGKLLKFFPLDVASPEEPSPWDAWRRWHNGESA